MQKIKHLLALGLLLFISLFIISCDGTLSRSKAEKLIKEKFQLPKGEIRKFKIIDRDNGWWVYTQPAFEQLQNEGVLTFSKDDHLWGGGIFGSLTEIGKKYSASDLYR